MRVQKWRGSAADGYELVVRRLSAGDRLRAVREDVLCGNGRHRLCTPPGWAYDVGLGAWRVWPERRANLGNLWWALSQRWLGAVPDGRGVLVQVPVPREALPGRVRRRLDARDRRTAAHWAGWELDDPDDD